MSAESRDPVSKKKSSHFACYKIINWLMLREIQQKTAFQTDEKLNRNRQSD